MSFERVDVVGLGIQILKLNNDVVNTVSKAAFALPMESLMNQTTLTSAMFQKSMTVIKPQPLDNSEPPLHSATATAQDPPPPLVERRAEPEKPTMEIDSGTFKELPKDIQDELLRDHKLVFLNENTSDVSGVGSGVMTERGNTAVEQPSEQKHGLPSWSQLDPRDLMALSTPIMRDTLKEYAELKQMDRGIVRQLSITATTTSRPLTATTSSRPPLSTTASPTGLDVNDHLLGTSFLPAPSQVSHGYINVVL